MTISSTTNRAQFNCDGSTTSFPFTFRYLEASDLQVYLASPTGTVTLLTLNVDYQITPAIPGPGGTLSFLGGYLSSPPGSGYTLTILRFVPRTQEVDFINGDSLDENNIEGMGDKLTMMVQDLDERIGRAVTVPPSSGISNISVPDPVAGAFLRWNLSGNGLENATYVDPTLITISDYWRAVIDGGDTLPEALTAMGLDPSLSTLTLPDNVTISDFAKTLLDDTDAATARATLGVPDASESAKGIAEIATQTEVNTGTDDARIVTPAKLYATPGIYRKNVIINGCARVAQRGGSHDLTTVYAYGAVDRWRVAVNSATGFTSGVTSQGASTAYVSGNFINFGSLNFTQANAVLCATRIEAKDAAFLYGKTISIQFKVWHNLGSTVNANGVILSANSVDNHATQTAQHIQSDVSCADNTVTTVKWEGLAINSACAINGFELAIVVDVVSCTNKSVSIGDVQLEIGNVCTPFDFRPYPEELALCQRYFWRLGYESAAGEIPKTMEYGLAGNGACINVFNPVPMRAAPTLTKNGTWATINCAQPTPTVPTRNGYLIYSTITATGYSEFYSNSSDDYVDADAEI